MKQREVEKLLNKMPSERYNKLVNLSKAITDFTKDEDGDEEDVDASKAGEETLAVVMDSDESDESDVDSVIESESDPDDVEGVEASAGTQIGAADEDGDDDEGDEAGDSIPVSAIDAFWLQREISKFYSDATVAQKLADDVLDVLKLSVKDERERENKLVMLLDYDKFDFIKHLLVNRSKIMYCTRLKRAQTDDERAAIEAEMRADVSGGGPAILEALNQTLSAEAWAQDSSRKFKSRVRKEARQLGKTSKQSGEEIIIDMDTSAGAGAGAGAGAPAVAGPRPDRVLDLDALVFSSGGHTMTNKRCELAEKAWRDQHDGYEEVHVPAVSAKKFAKGERLVPISELPAWARPAFKGMKSLNRVQSRLFKSAFQSPKNLLLCAPTGAGKTNVAVLTILKEIGLHMRPDGTCDVDKFKVVYVAPMKALVQECVINFSKRFTEAYGVKVRELSGDQSLSRAEIADTQVIVTTPEKWDIITRKSGDRAYTQLVRLVIIDEIHLLHDERGAVLESLVARTLRQVETTREMCRIVGLSATLPNYGDVAVFLRVDPKDGLYYFDNSFRPVPLQQQYIGVTEKKAHKRFQLMNQICYDKVLEQAGTNQVLVFVHSRKETAKTATFLRDMALENAELTRFIKDDSATQEILRTEAEQASDPALKDLLPYGFGIHHAGLTRKDRNLVEDLFADGHLQALVSTATLAWGVNLPAHAVIIKGTQIYNPEKGAWVELSSLDVMQMLGRAGRPQYDTFGEGVIITSHNELQFYLSLMNQQLPIESQLVKRLADALNGEIVLGTVTNVRDAADWLQYTYLYVRMLRNPNLYGVPPDSLESDPELLQHRLNLAHSAATTLAKHNLIKYDKRSGLFQVTALGRVASHYYVTHETIARFNEFLKPTMSEIELFRLFSLASEFSNIVVRQQEKGELTRLLERVPIPVKESIEEPTAKTNVLLQAYISRLNLDGFALLSDMVYVHQSAGRLMRALFEICLQRGWAALAHKTLNLCKMVDHRMWLSHSPLRQFTSLKPDIIRKLERKDIAWERYYDMRASQFGELVRSPKMGKVLHRAVHQFPRLELQAHVQPITRSILRVELTISPDFQWEEKIHGTSQQFWILVEDVDGETVVHHESWSLKQRYAQDDQVVTFTVPLYEPLPPQYFVRVVSDRWLHSECTLPISFRHLILPAKYPPHTELLDLQPLPVSALQDETFEALYEGTSHFNSIQTQVFSALYETDENVLVAAPGGSGKQWCAEFALMRMLRNNPEGRAVYVAPLPEIAAARMALWEERFGRRLGKRVVELTGETATDVKLVRAAQIIIATPEQWDVISRRWKVRKPVQEVALFIVDELHLIGGQPGPTLEVVTSRMRYIAAQLERKIRIVALSASVANARDLGEWIGATSSRGLFSFQPQVRPVPLEIRVQGFNISHFGARLMAMSRPVYSALHNLCGAGQPGIVFVPSRKQAQLTAVDIFTYADADGTASEFCGADESEMAAASKAVKDATLALAVRHGVAYIHKGMRASDRDVVRQLYATGRVRVLVATADSCWSLGVKASLVVVMGTQTFDGNERRYVDFPITDLLQMMSLASRPEDDVGRCVILCHAARKAYLKKFLYEPLPVESHLDHFLHDHMNAEVVTRTIENKQDAVDYVTWTYLYRRLAQNPNYYNLQGTGHQHLSDFLSELVETTLGDLQASSCVAIKNEMDVTPLNLGMIVSYYYITYTTIELFASSVRAKTKTKGLIEILSNASEYNSLAVRHREDNALRSLARELPVKMPDSVRYDDAHVKANILLQTHFVRRKLKADLASDQKLVVGDCIRLLQALVDVISSNGWLKPALACMELAQMVVQGVWADTDSPLMQIPHFTRELAAKCEAYGKDGDTKMDGSDSDDSEDGGINTVFDLMEMDDDERTRLLGFSRNKLADVARFCNRFPNVDVEHEIEDAGALDTNSTVRAPSGLAVCVLHAGCSRLRWFMCRSL